jgi:hypothetical protein
VRSLPAPKLRAVLAIAGAAGAILGLVLLPIDLFGLRGNWAIDAGLMIAGAILFEGARRRG